jgi:DNA-directed RNA polymerase specialized sigma24 family protein
MARTDQTDIGGASERFLTTHWSLIESIQSGKRGSQTLIGQLLQQYWKPVYCYLRRKGYDNERAKDLTQGFFQEVVLGRDLIGRADRGKGSFRKFLFTTLERYAVSVHRKENAEKRGPRGGFLRLDLIDMDSADLPELSYEMTPADSYHYAWLSLLLDGLLREVEAACHRQGFSKHWLLFRDRVVGPIMGNEHPPSLATLCKKHDVDNVILASHMVTTVTRRFRAALQRRLRQSVGSDAEVHEELRELICMFQPKTAQGKP